MVYMHDVAHVHNGGAVQTNIVHVDGNRSVLLSVFKNGATSTLDIVERHQEDDRGDQALASRRAARSSRSPISRCSCAPRSRA